MAIRSPLRHTKTYCRPKKRIPTTSDIGHWSRDGGIPRFIDLPPSPFRGNDTLFFTLLFLFRSAPVSTLATPFPSVRTGDFP